MQQQTSTPTNNFTAQTTQYFNTAVGQISFPSPQSESLGSSSITLAVLPIAHVLFQTYVGSLRPAKDNQPGSVVLVKVEGLEDLVGLMQSDTGSSSKLPWDVQQPPLLIEQLITNYMRGDLALDYAEALKSLKQPADFNAVQMLLDYARGKGVTVWNVEQELAAKGKIGSNAAKKFANQVYTQIFRTQGQPARIKFDLTDLLAGKPLSQVRRETLEFLESEVDNRFGTTSRNECKFVSFLQRAVAKALIGNEEPSSYTGRIEYKGETLTEAEPIASLRKFFVTFIPPYGTAALLEADDQCKLKETAKPVYISELNSLPDELKGYVRSVGELYTDFVFLTQVLYRSVLAMARRQYPGHSSEVAALLALKQMLPSDNYFPFTFSTFIEATRRESRAKLLGTGISLTTPVQAASLMIDLINEERVKALLPYPPYETLENLPLLHLQSAVLMLYEHLPRDALVAISAQEELSSLGSAIRKEAKARRQNLSARVRSLRESLLKDFGLNLLTVPGFSRVPEKGGVAETLDIYFGKPFPERAEKAATAT